jgi:hypothetical protein
MRYRDALGDKPEDPEATFKLAKALERLGENDGARCTYQDFLKVGSSKPFTDKRLPRRTLAVLPLKRRQRLYFCWITTEISASQPGT